MTHGQLPAPATNENPSTARVFGYLGTLILLCYAFLFTIMLAPTIQGNLGGVRTGCMTNRPHTQRRYVRVS